MSFMNPVDMVEEDAADLQFPKGVERTSFPPSSTSSSQKFVIARKCAKTKYIKCSPSSLKHDDLEKLNDLEQSLERYESSEESKIGCANCQLTLEEPYIMCNECTVFLCLKCFAQGREVAEHQNTHSYIVRRDDVQVFPSAGNWTAREERILLKTLQTEGYGNWSAVVRALNYRRNKWECRQHYHDCYFGDIFERLMGLQHERDVYFPQRLPYITKLRSVDPPRNDDDIKSAKFQFMAGYRAARGDFDMHYDNSAEKLLTILNEQDYDHMDDSEMNEDYAGVMQELKFALIHAYNHRLQERQRRYKIIRDHGLMVWNRTSAWISKYIAAFGSEASCSRFLNFMQISKPLKYDLLVESLNLFADLRSKIFRLYEARENGVSSLYGASLYFKLKKKRLQCQRDHQKNQYDWRKLLPMVQESNLKSLNPLLLYSNLGVSSSRRKPPPLDVMGLPGFIKLNEDERKLCSAERIIPEAFIEYKTILLAENAKGGQLRLVDARRLIKIDVNKTRKIYDFLIEQGYINKAI